MRSASATRPTSSGATGSSNAWSRGSVGVGDWFRTGPDATEEILARIERTRQELAVDTDG